MKEYPTHVCLIAKYTFPGDTRLMQQATVLSKLGIAVDIICLNRGDQSPMEETAFGTVYRIQKVKNSKMGFGGYLGFTLSFAMRAFRLLARRSKESNYQVIVVHTLPEFLVLAAAQQKWNGKCVVLDARDLTVDLLSSRWRGNPLVHILGFVARLVEFICINLTHGVVTASNGFKRALVARGFPDQKIQVVFNTADTQIFKFDRHRQFNPIQRGAKLMYHGTVSERFGVKYAIEALSIIQNQIPDSTLTIYGHYDPNYKVELLETISRLNLEKNVFLHESISLPEIYQLILNMDLGIVPYISDPFMNMALSTKTFEYVASGIPVVASRLASTCELFSETSIRYANPGDSQHLAEQIIALCRDPGFRNEAVKSAYAQFEDYSDTAMGARYSAFISQFIFEKKASH